jgi:GLPGLI family protein
MSIDTNQYSIIYRHKYFTDTVEKIPYYDNQVLEVGKKIYKFYSIFADRGDSVWNIAINRAKRPGKNHRDGIDVNKEIGLNNNERPVREYIYYNYPARNYITVSICIMNTDYVYEETVPKFDWKLHTDTATILGYKCIKATTIFRGRDYEVWFTPFISIRQGPWKFNGLPGLILKVSDTKGYFEWTAIEIENPQNRYIYIHELDKQKIIVTDRKNVMKLQRKQWDDHVGLIMSQGQKVMIRTKDGRFVPGYPGAYKFPYVPQFELE